MNGRRRIYLAAGVAGATLGDVLAAGTAALLGWLAPATTALGRPAALLYSATLILLGLALGASGGLALARGWFRAQGSGSSSPRRARPRPSPTPRPSHRARCTPVPDTRRRAECDARGA